MSVDGDEREGLGDSQRTGGRSIGINYHTNRMQLPLASSTTTPRTRAHGAAQLHAYINTEEMSVL